MRFLGQCGLASLCGTAVMLVSGAGLSAQQEEPAGSNRGTFSVLRDEARAFRWKDARRYLKEGKHAAAIESLLEVLKASPSVVVDHGFEGYLGLRELARRALRDLSPEARKAYQALIRRDADPMLADALASANPEALGLVSRRYPSSDQSQTARLLAGDLLLEEGKALRALESFARLPSVLKDPKTASRYLLCRKLLGLPLPSAVPRSLLFEGRKIDADAWRKRFGENPITLRDPWPAYGGALRAASLRKEPIDPWTATWQQELERLAPDDRYDLMPVSDGRRVFVNTGTSLYGFDMLRRGGGWQFEGPLFFAEEPWSFLAGISRYQTHSAAIGSGLVVAPLQVPVITDAASANRSFRGIKIMQRLPVRRLHAFEADTGRLRWAHWDELRPLDRSLQEAPLDVSGPPLVIGDSIYVTTHKQIGTIALYVSAFDLATGKLRWKTLVCTSQIEVNMFGNAQSEHVASPLAYRDGMLFGSTNLGVCFSVRTDDGSIRWLRSYPIIHIPRARMQILNRRLNWANNPPMIAEGRVVVTPMDSYDALCLSTDDGHLIWKMRYHLGRPGNRFDSSQFDVGGTQLRWLLGIRKGTVYFSGQGIATVPLAPKAEGFRVYPKMLATGQALGQDIPVPPANIPRGLLAEEHIYYISPLGGLCQVDYKGRVLHLDREERTGPQVGNLCASRGLLFAASKRYVTAFFSRERLVSLAAKRAREQPKDPLARLELAELLAASSNASISTLERAVRVFDRSATLARETGASAMLLWRAERGLFDALQSLAKKVATQNPAAAIAIFERAIDLGARLVRYTKYRSDFEPRLVLLYTEALELYRSNAKFREELLSKLERDHGGAVVRFAGYGKIPTGLYVLLTRAKALPSNARGITRRLSILRQILLDFGESRIHGETARAFAVRGIHAILEKSGRRIYAPYEREAGRLLGLAKDDPVSLQSVLYRFPCSEAAHLALTRLADAGVKNGQPRRSIAALALGLRRLPALSKSLMLSVARAAEQLGNLRLARALNRESISRQQCPEDLHWWPRLAGRPEQKLFRIQKGETLPAFSRLLKPSLTSGFVNPSFAADQLLLFSDRRGRLRAFRRAKGAAAAYSFEEPSFEVPFSANIRRIAPAAFGHVLVLTEEKGCRAVDLAIGKEIWTYDSDRELGNNSEIIASGPLRSGLFGAVVSSLVGDNMRYTLVAFEPNTGVLVHEQTLLDDISPTLRSGYCFQLLNPEDGVRFYPVLVVYDPLTGKQSRKMSFGTAGLPGFRHLDPRNVLVLPDSVLVLNHQGTGLAPSGLYCFDSAGKVRWKFQPRGSKAFGRDDSFLVSGEQVLALSGALALERKTLAWRIDRKTGNRLQPVECGWRGYFAHRPLGEPELRAPGPVLVLASDRGGRVRGILLNSSPGKGSWITPLPAWSVAELQSYQSDGNLAFGKETLVLGKVENRRRRNRLVLMMLRLESGHLIPSKGLSPLQYTGFIELSVHDSMLVVDSAQALSVYGPRADENGVGVPGSNVRKGSKDSGK